MGLLQWAYETYEQHAHLAGVTVAGQREPLTPVSHMIQNAHIEVTILDTGLFQGARAVAKEESKTIIPVTEESAGRTIRFTPHPLCDQLPCLCPWGGEKYTQYLDQLTAWAQSPQSHPTVRAVLAYVRRGSLLEDLQAAGLLELKEDGVPVPGRIEGTAYDKCLVRWRVLPPPEGGSDACWTDSTLFDRFAAWYRCVRRAPEDVCLLTGRPDGVPASHPKGVVGASFGAKLISANDSSGFTYRGRFDDAGQAGSVGYAASQKAHSALRWIAANQGVALGGRTFLCWNPAGAPVPAPGFLGFAPEEPAADPVSYKRQLLAALGGYRQSLDQAADDTVVLAALDAATTGRLSVTYYNALRGSDFLDRLQHWYDTCCWYFGWGKFAAIRSPAAKQIVSCAFGAQQGAFIQADDRLLRGHVQRLLHCIADRQPIPADLPRALAVRASTPLAYEPGNRAYLLSTACAVIRKYRNDRLQREEWTMALDKDCTDRSYLFGRLLAVAEQVEHSTYDRDEGREPNAIRMQSVFCRQPMYAWGILEQALGPYYARLKPGLRNYFKTIIGEIVQKLPGPGDPALNAPLDDVYLLGYYLQRSALAYARKDGVQTEKEEPDDESAAQ